MEDLRARVDELEKRVNGLETANEQREKDDTPWPAVFLLVASAILFGWKLRLWPLVVLGAMVIVGWLVFER